MRKPSHEMTNDPIVLKIVYELRVQGKTVVDLEEALGVQKGVVARWKYSNSKSYKKYINDIASFLNLTVKQLCEDAIGEIKKDVSASEMQIVGMYRQLGSEERKYILKAMESLIEISEYRESKKCG